MISFLLAAIKIIFLLGFLIFIHELGHFSVAKLCKVKVNEFAIGFGPVIWKKQGKETEYELRLIPLGGFVSMEGEEERSENERSFSKASIPRRMAIVLAGATVNIIFGVIIYFILSTTMGTFVTNEVDLVQEGFASQSVGIQNGDKIVEINGNKINNGKDLNENIAQSKGEKLKIKIKRNEEIKDILVEPTEIKSKTTGIYLDEDLKIISIQKGSSAEKAGILPNDKLIKINNEEIKENKSRIAEIIKENDVVELEVKRGKENIKIELTPDYISNYYLGVVLKKAPDTLWNRIKGAGMNTSEFMLSIVDNIKQLFTGKVGVDQMMGPVGISKVVAKTNGIEEFIYMMALISLSLGVTNLLPIPALDGGKMLILIIEAIRRKPMKEETEIKIQMLGFAILIAISIYVTYNDILRIL